MKPKQLIHPSIHFPVSPLGSWEFPELNCWAKMGYIKPQDHNHTNQPMKHVFGPWQKHANVRTCKLHIERTKMGIWTRTFKLWDECANHYTTVQFESTQITKSYLHFISFTSRETEQEEVIRAFLTCIDGYFTPFRSVCFALEKALRGPPRNDAPETLINKLCYCTKYHVFVAKMEVMSCFNLFYFLNRFQFCEPNGETI